MDALFDQMQEKKKPLAPFIVYLILFNGAWVCWVLFIYPRMRELGEASLSYALLNIALRLAIWVVPVLAYLRYVDHTDPVTYLKLSCAWRRGLQIGIGLTLLNLLLSVARFGVPHPNWHAVTWNNVLSTSLLIGFIEEIPFRGFILQKLGERMNFASATALSSGLFLAIHLPGWISLHMLNPGVAVFVFVFGVAMAIIFKYSNSLWSVIVAHSLNDFLSVVVFKR